MKFKSKKSFVFNGIKVYRHKTIVEKDYDLSAEDDVWYRIDSDEPSPAKNVAEVAKSIARPKITRIKK